MISLEPYAKDEGDGVSYGSVDQYLTPWKTHFYIPTLISLCTRQICALANYKTTHVITNNNFQIITCRNVKFINISQVPFFKKTKKTNKNKTKHKNYITQYISP